MVPQSKTTTDTLLSIFKTANGVFQSTYQENELIFAQGDDADCVFYILWGRVKKSYISTSGKERIVAILGARDFFGVGCVTGNAKRLRNATAMTACSVLKFEKAVILRALHEQKAVAERFISFLINRNRLYEDELLGHLLHSSEARLARTLLVLGEESLGDELTIPKVSQETLAEIVGTTRSRINFFMNKFRQMGVIDYHDSIKVRRSLLDTVLHERSDSREQ